MDRLWSRSKVVKVSDFKKCCSGFFFLHNYDIILESESLWKVYEIWLL